MSRKPDATPLTNYVMGRLGEVDAQLGNLTDYHLKWLVFFANEYFGAEESTLAIDVPDRLLTITPYKCSKMSFSGWEWFKFRVKLWWKRDERDLPGFLGIPEWTIRFVREPIEATDGRESTD